MCNVTANVLINSRHPDLLAGEYKVIVRNCKDDLL